MRRLLALGFCAAALFHAAALFSPAWGRGSTPWRHALFVAVNAAAAAGLLRYRRAYFPAFLLLAAQQAASHGGDGWRAWRVEGRADWASAAVLVFMLVLLALLAAERRRGGKSV